MIAIENLQHTYDSQHVLDLPDFKAAQGEKWLVLGNSGSGKSTLLHILAGILRPTKGSVRVLGEELSAMGEAARDRFRGRRIGIVFQTMHLLPTLTVEDNLLLAQFMAGLPRERDRVMRVLARVGIADQAQKYPETLSVGQKQRAAIARAVLHGPELLLADEPTSALDDDHCEEVITLLEEQAGEQGATLVIATHDARVKSQFRNTLNLAHGQTREVTDRPEAGQAA